MTPKQACTLVCFLLTAVQGFFRHFLIWSCFQAGVMFLQNLYQRRRMYTRIALGKNTVMDVVAGESSGSIGQLLILYPLLFSESVRRPVATFAACVIVIAISLCWHTAMLSIEWPEFSPAVSGCPLVSKVHA